MMSETHSDVRSYEDIEAEVHAFEEAERRRLGLDEQQVEHWVRPQSRRPSPAPSANSTTILLGGLTVAHDHLVRAAFGGLGYRIQPLDVPDTDALRFGKEFGNRGQCNPDVLHGRQPREAPRAPARSRRHARGRDHQHAMCS